MIFKYIKLVNYILITQNALNKLQSILATQSIEARTRQERRVSLYDWIVYKRGSKARERKGEEG